ncbi:histone H3 methyltransferase, partial [Volvox carteri f. nagariensis]
GLFAVEPIEPSEFVIEYCGQLIRKPLDDVRQRQYDAAGYADYMFAVDDNWVVDATLAGNAARFINHCCDPNCVARIVEVGGEKRIAIYTLRRVEAGEELHYDYKLSSVPGAERIPCGCGARNCKGFMN